VASQDNGHGSGRGGTRLSPGIIFNADDLGIHPRINAGILSAYRNGALSSATLLMTTPYLEETVCHIVRPAALPIGIHLSLTLGKAIAPRVEIPDLIDDEGYFRFSAQQLMLRSFRGESGRKLLRQVRLEIAAQLALARDWGIAPTHVDSHQHVHMRPVIYSLFQQEARRFGIERVRICREPLPLFAAYLDTGNALRRNNFTKWILIRLLNSGIHAQLPTTDRFFGVLYSGIISKRVLHTLLAAVDPKLSLEIGIHPGFPCFPEELSRSEAGFEDFISAVERQAEHDLLIDGELVEIFRDRGLLLRSYDGAVKPGWG
jgi:predicted glycoside hydrolase/deacetylase ChbG (UPF0249 family)